jgi:hypothetical protein
MLPVPYGKVQQHSSMDARMVCRYAMASDKKMSSSVLLLVLEAHQSLRLKRPLSTALHSLHR